MGKLHYHSEIHFGAPCGTTSLIMGFTGKKRRVTCNRCRRFLGLKPKKIK